MQPAAYRVDGPRLLPAHLYGTLILEISVILGLRSFNLIPNVICYNLILKNVPTDI